MISKPKEHNLKCIADILGKMWYIKWYCCQKRYILKNSTWHHH